MLFSLQWANVLLFAEDHPVKQTRKKCIDIACNYSILYSGRFLCFMWFLACLNGRKTLNNGMQLLWFT